MSTDTSAFAGSFTKRKAAPRIHDRLALPFYFIEPAVVSVDFVILVIASVVAGSGYHWVFLDSIPNTPPYIALGAYKFEALLNLKQQARLVTLVWIGVFLSLLAIAFTLKIGETLSRGATL